MAVAADNSYEYEKQILNDPVKEYQKYSKRLKMQGPNASFPEFKPVIDEIWDYLFSAELRAHLQTYPILKFEYNEVVTMLSHLNLKFSYENKAAYPYLQAYNGIYPYRPSLEAIEASIRLFDKIERLTNSETVALYHFDRYAYHKHSLFSDPEVVVFPTTKSLSFADLIRVRSVPIGLLGVSLKTLRVDRYNQSPLDFWYHDINHIRRLVAYLKIKTKAAKNLKEKFLIYKEMDLFIENTIMPNIAKLPKGSAEQDIALRRIVRLLFFEILHESAVVADEESILSDLIRSGDVKTPYELMLLPNTQFNIEDLRTATGNIESGANVLSSKNLDNQSLMIHYFFDRDLGLLANVYNKLNFGYYDEPDSVNPLVVPESYRKAKYIARAAQMIFEILGSTNIPSLSDLEDLVLSKKGKPELFNYKALQAHEADAAKNQVASEPLEANQAIHQILKAKRNKTIHSLFGYSDLGYKNKKHIMNKIEADLKRLDPNNTIILIGATEAGIGEAYQIAKKLGFETMGIVSIRALNYSGKFSPFVDQIFIINDPIWGGYAPNTNELSSVAKVFLAVSDFISAYGGGNNTLSVLQNADLLKIPYSFVPANMNSTNAKKIYPNMLFEENFFRGPVYQWFKSKQCSDSF